MEGEEEGEVVDWHVSMVKIFCAHVKMLGTIGSANGHDLDYEHSFHQV